LTFTREVNELIPLNLNGLLLETPESYNVISKAVLTGEFPKCHQIWSELSIQSGRQALENYSQSLHTHFIFAGNGEYDFSRDLMTLLKSDMVHAAVLGENSFSVEHSKM